MSTEIGGLFLNVECITAKSALSPSGLPGLDYALNPYRGCGHGCLYCYAPGIVHLDRSEWDQNIGVRQNLPLVLSKELKKKRPGVIGLSTVTDPYQSVEEKYCVTRYCLEQILQYDWPVSVQTRSDLIIRDIDLLLQLSDVEVLMSIGSLDEDMVQVWEPNAPSVNVRLQALKTLCDKGVKAGVFFGPVYPTMDETEIKNALSKFASTDVSFIMIDSLHLKPGVFEALCEAVPKEQEERIRRAILKRDTSVELLDMVRKKACDLGLDVIEAFERKY